MSEPTITAPSRTPVRRTVLPGVAMVAVTFGLARYGYGLLLPDMQRDLRLGATAAGVISSGTYASYLVANAAVVWVTDRHGPRWSLGLAAGTAATGMALVAVAHGALLLVIGVLVAGAAAGLALPPYADLLAREVPEPHRDLAWSTVSSGTGWGVALAGPVAILAGDAWRAAWLVFVALTVACGVVAVRAAPARRAVVDHRPRLSWTWFFCPKSRPLLLSATLVGAGSAVWWVFSVDALRDAGQAATAARTVYAVCGAASLLGSFSGLLFARVGLRTGYLCATVLLAASLGVLAAGRDRFAAALVAAVVFGVFYCTVIAAQMIWSAGVFSDHPAAGVAAVSTALTIGTLVGPALAGVATHRLGYPTTLVAAGAVIAVALPFCPPGPRRRRRLAEHVCAAAPVRVVPPTSVRQTDS